jgi:hypothetical protein
MIFRDIYRRWDEWSLQQMTPKREQVLLDRWDKLAKLGYVRFALPFLFVSLLFSILPVWIDRHISSPYPPGVDPNIMARIETWFDLTLTSIFVLFGLLLSLIFYFGYKMWSVKIAMWKAAGRL